MIRTVAIQKHYKHFLWNEEYGWRTVDLLKNFKSEDFKYIFFCSVLEIKYCWFFADHLRTKEEVKFTTDVAVISQQLSFSISKSFCKIVLNNERSKKRLLSNIISTQWITTDGRKVKLTWNKQPAAILDISETTKYYNLLQTFTFTLDLWKREPVRGQLPQGDSNLIAFIYKVYSPGTVSFLAWDKGQW